jgi:hypothetical protein
VSETFDFITPARPRSRRKRRILAVVGSLVVIVAILGVGRLVFALHNAPVTVPTTGGSNGWGWIDARTCQALAFNVSMAGTLRTNWTANPPGTLELVTTSSLGHPIAYGEGCTGDPVNSFPAWKSPSNVSGGDMAAGVSAGDYTLLFYESGSGGGEVVGSPLILTPTPWAW